MSNINISRKNPFSVDDAKQRVDKFSETMASNIGVKTQWAGDQLKFDGKGAKGAITVSENSIDVDIKLGMFLKPLSGKISSKVEEALDSAIQSA